MHHLKLIVNLLKIHRFGLQFVEVAMFEYNGQEGDLPVEFNVCGKRPATYVVQQSQRKEAIDFGVLWKDI